MNYEPFHLTGHKNAVSATLACLKASSIPVDEPSFQRLAELRGDAAALVIENGFIVVGYEGLQRLCDIGDMIIHWKYGVVTAYGTEEWTAGHELTLEPQPIADQWMAKCACGWRDTASFYEFDDRDDLLAELRMRHAKHVDKVRCQSGNGSDCKSDA